MHSSNFFLTAKDYIDEEKKKKIQPTTKGKKTREQPTNKPNPKKTPKPLRESNDPPTPTLRGPVRKDVRSNLGEGCSIRAIIFQTQASSHHQSPPSPSHNTQRFKRLCRQHHQLSPRRLQNRVIIRRAPSQAR